MNSITVDRRILFHVLIVVIAAGTSPDRGVRAQQTSAPSSSVAPADETPTNEVPVAVERRQVERREKVARRRQIDPTTCEREYSDEEIAFMQAMDAYKRKSGRMFPTCSEILEVIREMGYVKLTPAAEPVVPVAVDAANESATIVS